MEPPADKAGGFSVLGGVAECVAVVYNSVDGSNKQQFGGWITTGAICNTQIAPVFLLWEY
jgi:hypothetical protein